ncbi:hypothetical protein CHS0354_019629 [Potamilus streckersoni]|uniref:Major facilitator superfamily (MFS) profile domain-containing protein n=1 Tax=Potamilus streckersoni TaxID=2493646 RepID=A0AAE0T8S3_9BIVA|nr:hypothetical protein CHS0354_019629 [Potamilus streckersoni]
MAALNTNVINFKDRLTGKIVGFLNVFFAVSASIFATIFYAFFGTATDVEHQDLGGFMFLFAICFGVVDMLCMIFLRVYNAQVPSSSANIENLLSREEDPNQRESTPLIINKLTPLPIKQLLTNGDYCLFSLTFAFASSIGLVLGNNLTVISKSMHLDCYNARLVLIIPITSAITSLSIGIISDYFKKKVPRLTILISGYCGYIVCLVICLIHADKLAALYIATTIAGIGNGINWSISPTIMKEMFYVGNLGRNWGIAILGAALFGCLSQVIFGALYDAKITENGDTYCYGMQCFRVGFATSLVIACLSVILGVFLKCKHIKPQNSAETSCKYSSLTE